MEWGVGILVAGYHECGDVDAGGVAIVELGQLTPLGLDGVGNESGLCKPAGRFRWNGAFDGKIFNGVVKFVCNDEAAAIDIVIVVIVGGGGVERFAGVAD